MKFINVIREGDFVRLKTLSQLEKEFGKAHVGVSIGSFFFGDCKNMDSTFFVYKNVREELGNVLRIKRVKKLNYQVFFYAENNEISYDYEDTEDVIFEKQIVDAVLINGRWYQAETDLNILL